MSNTQTTYIDLPGENVVTNRQKSKLKVILRNHRDIILDIDTGSGGKLTAQCDSLEGILPKDSKFDRKTSFYSRDNERIINRGKALIFKDGNSQHLYVSREFEGVLTIYKGRKIVIRIPVKKFDNTSFSNDPLEKPAPILIRINKNSGLSIRDWSNGTDRSHAYISQIFDTSNLVKDIRADKSMTGWEDYGKGSLMIPTIEILTPNDIQNIPEDIWKYLGEGNKSVLSADVDQYGIITQNLLYNQIGASVAFTADNWKWLKETIKKKKKGGFEIVKVHFKRGTVKSGERRLYAYFSGYTKSNNYFKTGVRQLSSNPVVMPFTSGAGSVSGIKQALKQNLSGTFKNNALVYFVLSSAISLAEWKADQSADGYDLAGALISNIIKAIIISAAVTILAGTLVAVIAAIVAGGSAVAIPAIVIGAIYVGLGILVGLAVECFEKKLTNGKGISSFMSVMLRNIGEWLKDTFKELNTKSNHSYEKFDYDFCRAC